MTHARKRRQNEVQSPNALKEKLGAGRFASKLHNNGALEHEFVLASREDNLAITPRRCRTILEMEHSDPNAKRLLPSMSGEMVWRFYRARLREFEYGFLIHWASRSRK